MTEAFTTTARLYIENDVIWVKYAAGVHIQVEDIMNIYFIINRWQVGNKKPVIVDVRDPYTITAEARECAVEQGKLNNLATALITTNILFKYLSDIYARFQATSFPVKVFFSEEKALQWIEMIRKDKQLKG